MADTSPGLLPSLRSDNPFATLRKQTDQAHQSLFGKNKLLSRSAGEGLVAPSIDVAENDASIVLPAAPPGIWEDDIDISIHNSVPSLKGEKKMEKKDDTDNYHVVERLYGSFRRLMRLPSSVDEAALSANSTRAC